MPALRRRVLGLGLLATLAALGLPALAASTQDTPGLHFSIERQPGGWRRAVVQNTLAGPQQVRVWHPQRPGEAVEATLAAGETRALGRFPGEGRAELRLLARPGEPLPLPPTQRRPYAFPLPAAAQWRLTQGFGGRASHRDVANFHALDLAAPQGTPVLAAREGVVMQVIDHFHEGGTDTALLERGNLVRVLHADGSMGLYAHIATGSARVRPGEAVRAGDTLAAVGSVGWSTAPHLHFAVQINDGRELLSLPFRMAGPDGRPLGAGR